MKTSVSRSQVREPREPSLSNSQAELQGQRLIRDILSRRHKVPESGTPSPRPTGSRISRHETSLFQRLFRGFVTLAALLLLLTTTWKSGHLSLDLGLTLMATLLLVVVRLFPVAFTRERPLTFLAPAVFGIALWFRPNVAIGSVLLACWLHTRFRPHTGYSPRYLRFQGAQLALSAYISNLIWTHFQPLEAIAKSMSLPRETSLTLLAIAAWSGLAFIVANLLLTLPAHFGMLASWRRNPQIPHYVLELALIYLVGMLPVLILAPWGTAWGVWAGLPLMLLLILGAQTVHLGLEVRSLYGQLETAEAMGQASIPAAESQMDSEGVLDKFLSLAQQLVEAENSFVWTMNQESGELTLTLSLPHIEGLQGRKAVYAEGLVGHVASRMQPRCIADAEQDRHRGPNEVAIGAWLLYPIILQERLLGVAQWVRPLHRPFTKEDVARLDTLVPQAAVALENVRIRGKMHDLAATDGLTSLWNQRRLYEILQEEIYRASRYERVLSVLMLDVDSFKSLNDTYGHVVGDQFLRNLSSLLRVNTRTVDHLGRYGGEEFMVILPETSKDDAYFFAERIRQAVEEQGYVDIGEQRVHRTLSLGLASFPEDALSPGELVQCADEALYRAKREGKNRVVWA